MNLNFDTLAFENCDIAAGKLAFACSNGDLTWLSFSEQVHSLIEVFQSISLPKGHPVMIYGHKEKLFPVAKLAPELSAAADGMNEGWNQSLDKLAEYVNTLNQ